MFYLNIDKNGYLLSVSSTNTGGPSLETLDGFDFSGYQLFAYRWDGTNLVLDANKLSELASIDAEEKKMEKRVLNNVTAQQEIISALLTAQINTLDVDDNTALRWIDFYPMWEANKEYPVNYKIQYEGKLYKVITQHTSQESWLPDHGTESLYQRIDETHAGTLEDPIPYEGNMALEAGKYYSQNEVIYLCTSDTVNPVYHALSDLVGLYVSVVE